jgi:hypothetical protein
MLGLAGRISTAVGLAVVAVILAAEPASAHAVHYGDDPSNWRSSITAAQIGPGVSVSLGDGAQRLHVAVRGSRDQVVILGYSAEPFLRLTGHGVWLNQRSPTTWAVAGPQATRPSDVAATAAPRWKLVSSTGSWTWHDARTHWPGYALPPPVEQHPDRRQQVLTWTVPLLVDGRPGVIAGTLDWVPGPDPAPSAAIGALALVVGGCIGLLRRWRTALAVGLVLVTLGDIAHAVAGVDGRIGSTWTRLGAVPGHGVVPLCVWLALSSCAVAFIRRRSSGPVYVAAMLLAVVFLVDVTPSLGVAWRSQATTQLPISIDRYLVAMLTGLCAGLLAAAILLLRRQPLDVRRPALVPSPLGGNEC